MLFGSLVVVLILVDLLVLIINIENLSPVWATSQR